MKKLTGGLLIAITLFVSLHSIAEEILTNQSVIALTGAKMSKDIIISKIDQLRRYDMSSNGIIGLKDGKVSDQVVIVMLSSKQSSYSYQ
ncbi:MAG: hypothetical protein U0X76_00455 [Bacteroidia bacterium]